MLRTNNIDCTPVGADRIHGLDKLRAEITKLTAHLQKTGVAISKCFISTQRYLLLSDISLFMTNAFATTL